MALGAIMAYLGVYVVAGSPGAGLLWLLGAVALLTYIRLVEEQEMVAHLSEAYLACRRRVSFVMPRSNHVGARHAQSRAFGASCPYSSRAFAARFVQVLPASARFSPENKGPSPG